MYLKENKMDIEPIDKIAIVWPNVDEYLQLAIFGRSKSESILIANPQQIMNVVNKPLPKREIPKIHIEELIQIPEVVKSGQEMRRERRAKKRRKK